MMLPDICLSVAYIGPKSRTERPRKTKKWHKGRPRHMWLGHHFQGQIVKGQGHQAALLTAALTRQAAAAVSVGTYILAVGTYCYALRSALCRRGRLGGVRRFGTHRGRRGVGHIVAAARLQLLLSECVNPIFGCNMKYPVRQLIDWLIDWLRLQADAADSGYEVVDRGRGGSGGGGGGGGGRLVGRLCGDGATGVFHTTAAVLHVKFVSDSSVECRGFWAFYRQTRERWW